MPPEEIDADLQAAVDERLEARLERARQQRAARRARAREHHNRRTAGLEARHRNKLARLRDQDTTNPDEATPPTDDAA